MPVKYKKNVLKGASVVPLKSELQNELVSRIKEMIRSRDHQSDGRIREAVLSRVLSVSRTPVRAALQHLVNEGIVEPHRQGGYTVLQTPPLVPDTMAISQSATGLYGRMLRDIILNEMADPVSEIALVRRYQAGRGEILQVLRRLVRDGLAEPLPGRGWAMLRFDGEQMSRSYHLRFILEPAMLLDRDYVVNRDTLERLRDDHQRALMMLSPESPWQELFELDATFHEALARGSNNDLIVDIIRRQNRFRRLAEFFSYSRLERIRASMIEHIAIIEALLVGDQTWASALMRQHLTVSRTETEENLKKDLEAVRLASSGIERLT
jgi:DNA-binding GntR family transcriptional regulator